METIKRKIKETTTETREVEIKLPYYSKSDNGFLFYKVINSEYSVAVNLYGFHTAIEYSNHLGDLPFSSDCYETTKEEFQIAYDKALRILAEKERC